MLRSEMLLAPRYEVFCFPSAPNPNPPILDRRREAAPLIRRKDGKNLVSKSSMSLPVYIPGNTVAISYQLVGLFRAWLLTELTLTFEYVFHVSQQPVGKVERVRLFILLRHFLEANLHLQVQYCTPNPSFPEQLFYDVFKRSMACEYPDFLILCCATKLSNLKRYRAQQTHHDFLTCARVTSFCTKSAVFDHPDHAAMCYRMVMSF